MYVDKPMDDCDYICPCNWCPSSSTFLNTYNSGILETNIQLIRILHKKAHVTYMYVPCQTSNGENKYQVYRLLYCIFLKDIGRRKSSKCMKVM